VQWFLSGGKGAGIKKSPLTAKNSLKSTKERGRIPKKKGSACSKPSHRKGEELRGWGVEIQEMEPKIQSRDLLLKPNQKGHDCQWKPIWREKGVSLGKKRP